VNTREERAMREDDREEAQADLLWQVREGIAGAQERLDAFNAEVEEEWSDIEQRLEGVNLDAPVVPVCPSAPTLRERLDREAAIIKVDVVTGELVKVREASHPLLS
jgi:hypothetical protein